MEIKVIIHSDNRRAKMVFIYNDNGNLVGFHLTGEYNKTQEQFILNNIASVYTYDGVKAFCAAHNIKGQGLTGGTEFDDFWEQYKYKDGNKERAKALWAKLDVPQRVLAIEYIKKYNAQLIAAPGRQKLLPETYLQQRRWENEN